jgi:hypothetical protein
MNPRRFARRRESGVLVVASGLVAAWPRFAEACAVCFGGGDSNWTAGFFAGTVLMLLLPPALVVTAGIVIYRATKRQEARRAAQGAASRPTQPTVSSPSRAASPLHLVR